MKLKFSKTLIFTAVLIFGAVFLIFGVAYLISTKRLSRAVLSPTPGLSNASIDTPPPAPRTVSAVVLTSSTYRNEQLGIEFTTPRGVQIVVETVRDTRRVLNQEYFIVSEKGAPQFERLFEIYPRRDLFEYQSASGSWVFNNESPYTRLGERCTEPFFGNPSLPSALTTFGEGLDIWYSYHILADNGSGLVVNINDTSDEESYFNKGPQYVEIVAHIKARRKLIQDILSTFRITLPSHAVNFTCRNTSPSIDQDNPAPESKSYELINAQCTLDECLVNIGDSSYPLGTATISGYFTPVEREAFGEIKTCDSFTVTGGSDELIRAAVALVDSGNTVHSKNEFNQPVINLDLGLLSQTEKRKILQSAEIQLVELLVLRQSEGDRGVPVCYPYAQVLRILD